MTERLSHEAADELLGAYALDAVDADEAISVEDHLRECARCRVELASLREAAAHLAHQTVDPPPLLWDRIAAGVHDPAPPALELIRVRRRASPWRLVAAAAAIVLIVLSGIVIHQQRQLDDVQDALHQQGLASAAVAAFDRADARHTELQDQSGRTVARAVTLPDGNGYLFADQLSPLPTDRTYQLWAIVGGAAISVGVLGPDPSLVAFHVDAGATQLAVSNEHAGGAQQPTATPTASGLIA